MSRHDPFGWDYPPGVTSKMIDDLCAEGPCAVCGFDCNDCTCPECPVCKEHGNPDCQVKHGLILSDDQEICNAAEGEDADIAYDRWRDEQMEDD